MIHGIFHGDLHGGNLFVLPDGRTALLDFGIVGRLDEERRLAFLRLMVGATDERRPRPAGGAARPRRAARRHRPRRVIRDLGLDQPAGRPDHAHRRRDGEGDPAGREGAARLRRHAAEGADALREEHGVPRRRHRPPRPRPRPLRRDRLRSRCCSPSATASRSARELGLDPRRSRSTSTASRPASALDPTSTALTYRELPGPPRS